MDKLLEKLFFILQNRKHSDHKSSYVSSLYNNGIKKLLKKLNEETNELIIAIQKYKENKCFDKLLRYEIIKETADLCFHILICISFLEIGKPEIVEELSKRLNISGFEEKNNRLNI
ncbi:Phosphoribosyl-ATP pyrophosphatase [Candidatus Portiera aleyrodidarum]|uniref:phosphoribosyl-ATP diphosphatase n=1 Tax=Candidatus Portiera aleyrodidarum TaxID=91844 RepID=A0A6S6RTM3_9GAMM|nr:phosphoribosyl-ATP diphosphatase [Candidatus Portiera aleyrodidarum]CAA3708455.1 Phosphoribosyl-ATP pyrophosphatase [Candidatus Portiera aleyrodidarum]